MITYANLGSNGRLGNQMFQIASTIGIAIKNGIDYCFPHWNYAQNFFWDIPAQYPYYLDTFDTYKEVSPYYNDVELDPRYNWNLDGYFQSWKYFDHCKSLILDTFKFSKLDVPRVAIHVRRGDYLRLQHMHPVLPAEYYIEAIKQFPFGTKFTVFSDDMDWCINNFLGSHFEFSRGNSDIEDLQYMANHQGVIMANSSFSWWAGYLCGGKVVAPRYYVVGEEKDDRIPPDWIKI